jgi:glycosyltransferase involved in cell wall biosynthesis
MGYLENMLPKYLARLGAEVHVISTDLPPYYWINEFEKTYSGFCSKLQPGAVESIDGFTLHVLGHQRCLGHVRMIGMTRTLRSLHPDVVQTTTVIGWTALEAAFLRPYLRYRLFTGSHTTASVFPLANRRSPWWERERLRCALSRGIPGYIVSLLSEKCYGATCDCADVAVRFFGVPQDRMAVQPLGVDTDLFYPRSTAEDANCRRGLRRRLGFRESDIVCIYTGRFTDDKNPLLLAKAIEQLSAENLSYRGLFVGNGPQSRLIDSCAGCLTLPFVPVSELGNYFRAADVGVWPTQESTSMLDAAGCGLPIVVNDTVRATERVEGNGLTHRLNDLSDLVRTLRSLRDVRLRAQLGSIGAHKISQRFGWATLAAERLRDYERALAAAHKAPVIERVRSVSR